MSLPLARVDLLVWALIYGGLGLASIGVALSRQGASYGWLVIAAGIVSAAAGVVLLWVRSRLRNPADKSLTSETP